MKTDSDAITADVSIYNMYDEILITLTVVGEADDVKNFYNVVTNNGTTKVSIFGNILPIPDGVEDVHTWCSENWGASRGDFRHKKVTYTEGDKRIEFGFSTTDSDGSEEFTNVANKFPALTFLMTSSSDEACCVVLFQNGECVCSAEGYHEDDDEDYITEVNRHKLNIINNYLKDSPYKDLF